MQNYFVLDLPSKGLVYPNYTKGSIKVRPLTGGDESILATMNERNMMDKLIEVLQRTVEGIDVRQMTLGDKIALMVWHGINSYTDGFTSKVTCEGCLQSIQVDYKLADSKVQYLPDHFKEPYPVELSNGTKVKCRLLRVSDEIAALEYEKKLQDFYLYRIALTVVDDKDIVQRVDWLAQLPAKDVAKIRAFQDVFYHGPTFIYDYQCSLCGYKGTFYSPFRFEHFFPYGDALRKNYGIKI